MSNYSNSSFVYFRDSEELSAALDHTDVRAAQISKGEFRCGLSKQVICDWTLQHLRFEKGVSTCVGSSPADRLAILLPIAFAPGSRLLGRELTHRSVAVYPPNSEHVDISVPDFQESVLALPPELGQRILDEVITPSEMRSGSYLLEPDPNLLEELRRTVVSIESIASATASDSEVSKCAADLLTRKVSAVLSPLEVSPNRGRPQFPRTSILRKVHEILELHEFQPIYSTGLANELGISPPTLHRTFLELFGVPPARYLFLKRLYLARTRLQSGEYGTVNAVAHSCGFWELGRFASQYRRLFGELPSEALKR